MFSKANNPTFAAGILLTFALIAYSNSFSVGFFLDDSHQVANNPNVRVLANLPRLFADARLGSYDPAFNAAGYRPVTYASFVISYAVSGYNVWSYHVFNLLIHFLNAFLVFLIIRATSGAAREDASPSALVAAVVFALHPIQTSAVTYISGRAVLLASLFYLLSFHVFLRFRSSSGKGAYAWGVLAPVFFLLGLLSKEMAVSLPALLLAYDLIVARAKIGGIKKLLNSAWVYALYILVLVVYLAVRGHLVGASPLAEKAYGTIEYLMSEAGALLLYIRLLILPFNQNFFYDLPLKTTLDASVAASAVLVAASLFILYRLRESNRALTFFGLWFFIALAPESTLVPINDIAVEYRLYLPSVGFIAALAILASNQSRISPGVKKGAALALVAMLLMLTFIRNNTYADTVALWGDTVKKSPQSSKAHVGLGSALNAQGRVDMAIDKFDRALSLDPKNVDAYINKGAIYNKQGLTDMAIGQYMAALKIQPNIAEAHNNLGTAYLNKGLVDEALKEFQAAVNISPYLEAAHKNVGIAYIYKGLPDKAIEWFQSALRLDPDDADAHNNLGAVYADKGLKDKALKHFREAVRLRPDNGSFRNNLSRALNN